MDFCARVGRDYWIGEYRYELTLAEGTRVLSITNAEEMLEFTNRYSHDGSKYHPSITWDDVAQDYDAVEVVPHMPELEKEFGWYIQWDLASGVVFHPDRTIVGLELIESCSWKESSLLSPERRRKVLGLDQER